MRLRENAEGIAMYNGGADEAVHIAARLSEVHRREWDRSILGSLIG